MRRAITVAPLVLGMVLAGTAFGGIATSVHNLSGGPVSAGEICKPCHVPHNNSDTTTGEILWNHEISTETFTHYVTTTGNTGNLTGSSKLCMGCHDGVTAVDSYGGASGSLALVDANWSGTTATVGTDLSDDHPIGVDYPVSSDYTIEASLTGAKIVSGKVECASCHDPHDDTNTKFLRMANTNSDLCLDCHVK